MKKRKYWLIYSCLLFLVACAPSRPAWIEQKLEQQRKQLKELPSLLKTQQQLKKSQKAQKTLLDSLAQKRGLEKCASSLKSFPKEEKCLLLSHERHRRYLPDGSILEEKFFIKDSVGQKLLDSTFLQYYANGVLAQGSVYKNGKKHGNVLKNDLEGKPRYVAYYWRGLQDGISQLWQKEQLLERTHWVRGVRHGLEQSWDLEGNLVSETPYHDGLQHGVHKLWKKQKLLIEIEYILDTLHGNSKQWYPNGQKKQKIPYYKGKIVGHVISWHPNGIQESKIAYHNDKRHGKAEGWHSNKRKSYEINYRKGKREGLSKTWNKRGRLLTLRRWKVDVLHGRQVNFSKNKKSNSKWDMGKCISGDCF